ncbi:hypothetical protein BDV29DRAFT_180719 [Aspergillus leporis]|uniref:Uncharacterized protein n=1 Tax=Aspergillus leporis TaxID=41062 RepID=A0A5N5WTZ3_9EURO|nr:hypothetical protein BDV29DRAFT_180719 [Aspergillus leporis]
MKGCRALILSWVKCDGFSMTRMLPRAVGTVSLIYAGFILGPHAIIARRFSITSDLSSPTEGTANSWAPAPSFAVGHHSHLYPQPTRSKNTTKK